MNGIPDQTREATAVELAWLEKYGHRFIPISDEMREQMFSGLPSAPLATGGTIHGETARLVVSGSPDCILPGGGGSVLGPQTGVQRGTWQSLPDNGLYG